jgi:hypothetical protein
MDINGNVIPFIGGEEEKMQQETQKILGDFAAITSSRWPPRSARTAIACRWSMATPSRSRWSFPRSPREADLRNAFETFAACRRSAICPARRRIPVQYMPENDRPQPRKDAERDRGMATFIGRLRPARCFDWKFVALGHNTVRGAAGRGRAERRTDALGRAARLMIVMKFGGTSVESAAAIERVAAIVKARAAAIARRRGLGHGQDHQQAAGHRQSAIEGKREEYIRQLHDLRDFHSREARQVVPLADRAELDRTLDEHFQELTELVKGIAVLGELTPRSIDAISSYGERLSSYIVTLAFEHFGMPAVHLDSRR